MPVLTTAFDQDFFQEPLIEYDQIESPCKRKCSKHLLTIRRETHRSNFAECDMNIYQPVCDLANRQTYQNPCLLGCRKILKGKYADCLCLPKNSTVTVGQFESSIISLR